MAYHLYYGFYISGEESLYAHIYIPYTHIAHMDTTMHLL